MTYASATHPAGLEFTAKGGPLGANDVLYKSTGTEFIAPAWGKPGRFLKAYKWMVRRNEWAKTPANVFIGYPS